MRPEHSETKIKTETRECETEIETETETKNLLWNRDQKLRDRDRDRCIRWQETDSLTRALARLKEEIAILLQDAQIGQYELQNMLEHLGRQHQRLEKHLTETSSARRSPSKLSYCLGYIFLFVDSLVAGAGTGAVLDKIFIFVVSNPSILPIWPPLLISL